MASRGFFLTLEGIDGCGKTTHLDLLIARLRASGRDPVRVQEPGGTRIGLEIRKILLDRANSELVPTAELLLYFASRAQNIAEVIRPALERGQVVVADRFTDATMAYQGYGREMGPDIVRTTEAIACGGLRPDLTLWLDISLEQEGREFYRRVYQGYRDIATAEPARVAHIDASGTIDQVADLIWAKVNAVL